MNACTICSTAFEPKRHTTGLYCGRRCAWLARGGPAFNAAIARASAESRSAVQRDRGAGRSYRKLMGRHEHRVIAEAVLGRPLHSSEVVHHVDGNKRNNSPANLEVLTQAEHMRRHGIGIPGVLPAGKPWIARWAKGKTE